MNAVCACVCVCHASEYQTQPSTGEITSSKSYLSKKKKKKHLLNPV